MTSLNFQVEDWQKLVDGFSWFPIWILIAYYLL